MKPYKLVGNALCGFLDFSAGIFIVFLGTIFLNYQAGIPSYILGGILGLAPDFDVIYILIKNGKMDGDHHQLITHRPIFGITLFSTLGFLLGGTFWAVMSFFCITWHYLHDTEGIFGGEGIAWLWPFSKLYYSPWRAVLPEESLMTKYADHEKWLDETWLKPSKISLSEIIVGLILLQIVAEKVFNWKVGMFFILVIWLCLVLLWSIEKKEK